MNKFSTITLVSYDVKKDRKNFIVKNKATNEYFEMPALAVEVIGLLSEGNTLESIQSKMEDELRKEKTSILEFAEMLLELNFIVKIDNKEIVSTASIEKIPAQFLWVSPLIGKIFFNSISTKIYFLVFISTLILLLNFPSLIPVYQDLFISELNTLNMLIIALVSLLFVLVHEAGHILAVRAKKLPARLELGNRLFFIVLQTDLSEAWQLSPKNRTTLYLGGIYFDLVILFVSLVLQLFFFEMELVTGVLRLISLTTILRLLYQICFFMKTDLYYVLENVTGVYNLMENSKSYLLNRMPYMKNRQKEEVYAGEEWLVKWYGLLYVLGTVIMLGLFAVYSFPQIIFIFKIMVANIQHPISAIEFWDGFLVFLQLFGLTIFLAVSWCKKVSRKSSV
ncbi:MAG: hypothetical protein ACQEUT_15225 [Bacillota bacterium]